MTNTIPILQLAAQHADYNVSTGEIAAICAIAGAAVHIAHQAVAAYGRAGGYQGILRFLKSGSTAVQGTPGEGSGSPTRDQPTGTHGTQGTQGAGDGAAGQGLIGK